MSVQRQVCPLQCTAEPPTTSPGRNEPRRRIGSAFCDGLLRIVSVSRAVFCMRSWRTTKRSSSRTIGTAKSFSGLRIAPRSSATTLSPASVNSFARMPPVQPSPTMTASTSFNFVAILPPSAHVRDADGVGGEGLVAIFLDVLAMHRDHPGETDQPPAHFVAVAAIDRSREHPFDDALIHGGAEHADGKPSVEPLAVGLAAMGIGRCDAGAIELRGRERQLVALARHAHLPRPLHIEPLALAPGACERAVDVDVDADLGAFGCELVRWHHVIDQRLDESSLVEVQELVALGRRWGGGLLRLRARSRNGGCGGRRGRTARDRRFQEITPAEALIRHVFLPASDSTSWCQRSFLAWTKNAPFPVAAARLFSAGTASTHLESCNGLPTAGGCTGRCDTR